ncbi:MAG: hypothetical protein LBS50_11670 [Prevotellaceae bacterium]|jgi:hypothetical protein|nr:hypothetical protein [Prevotellaceae bacterium]
MKKSIIFLVVFLQINAFFLNSQTKSREKEKTPEQYQLLGENFYKDYQFEQAAECFAKSSDSVFYQRAITAAQMLQRVENVEFIDSVVVPTSDILQYFPKNEEIGFVFCAPSHCRLNPQSPEKKDTTALFGFLTGKKDRKIFAKNDSLNLNLYQSDLFLDGWHEPTPLSSNINSEKDENFPFVLSDGVTIFFASKGHNSLGGYDIFMSRSNSAGKYLLPQNAGMPFNSPANDYLMVIDERQKLGYFASDRNLPSGKTAIYTFIHNSEKNILKNLTEGELRAAARIENFRIKREKQKTKTEENQQPIINNQQIFAFVLTDTVVYHSFSDFKNTAALEKFKLLQQKTSELENSKTELENLRKDYFFALNLQKFILKEKIISFENLVKNLQHEVKKLENEVRKLELLAFLHTDNTD